MKNGIWKKKFKSKRKKMKMKMSRSRNEAMQTIKWVPGGACGIVLWDWWWQVVFSLIWHEVIIDLQQFKSRLTCNFSNLAWSCFSRMTRCKLLFFSKEWQLRLSHLNMEMVPFRIILAWINKNIAEHVTQRCIRSVWNISRSTNQKSHPHPLHSLASLI